MAGIPTVRRYICPMIRRTVLACSAVLTVAVTGVASPTVRAASVGSGACVTTVDNATGVTSTVAPDGACVVTFATAPTTPTTSTQYAARTWTVPAGITSVDVLVVAGGGGGGMSNGSTPTGGGGGGGGIVLATGQTVTPASSVTVWTGYGGQGGNCSPGNPGGNSKFGTLVAVGGGFGGGCGPAYGGPGGNAGGAHWGQPQGSSTQASSGTASNGTNITAYGNSGGKSYPHGVSGDAVSAGGGGGGGATQIGGDATQPGANSSSGVGGNGGEGLINDWRTGSGVVYGSGGGGQARAVQGVGGTNGGTASGTNTAGGAGIDAVDETGAGGGGGYRQGGGRAGDGGSGVVIVRYYPDTTPSNSVAPAVSGTTTNGQTLTATRGTWSGYPTPTYAYRWKRATSAAGSYSNITGATALTYTLTDDDIDMYLKFEVTATNSSASVVALSAATARIADMVRPTTTTTSTTSTTTTVVAPATTAPALIVNVSAPTTTYVVVPSAGATTVVPNVSVPAATVPAPRSAAATTTSTTVATAPTTTAVPAPKAASVVSGQAAVTVGDESVTPTVERRDNKLVITAGRLTASLASLDSSGNVAPLDADGNVRLTTGQKVQVNASGFEPGSTVEVWLFSAPRRLGEMKVDTSGKVSGTFEIPAGLPAGSHRMVIVTRGVDEKETSLTVGVTLGEWKKTKNIATWLIVLPIVLAVAGALTLPATRRRRRRMSATG